VLELHQALPGELGALARDPKRRSEVVLLYDSVRSIRDVSEMALPAIAGITVGFNSSDGD
jgi:predicted lipoprotein